MKAANRKRIIKEEKIEKIKTFWQRNSHKALRMCDIKEWSMGQKCKSTTWLFINTYPQEKTEYELSDSEHSATYDSNQRTHTYVLRISDNPMQFIKLRLWICFCWWNSYFKHRSRFKGCVFKDCKSAVTSAMDKF